MYCDIIIDKEINKWCTLSQPVLIEILKREGLKVKEVDLFDSVLEWGKAEARRQNRPINKPEDLKPVLREVITYIRFPAMQPTDLATKVEKSKLLEPEQLLALFTYCGAKGTIKLDSSIKFNTRLRVPREPIGITVFDPDRKSASLLLSNGNKTVTHQGGNNLWRTVACKNWITQGQHKIKFRIDTDANTHWIMLGVVTRTFTRWNDTATGYLGYTSDSKGWSSAGASPYLLPGGRAYGSVWRQGDTIEMQIDMEKHTLS